MDAPTSTPAPIFRCCAHCEHDRDEVVMHDEPCFDPFCTGYQEKASQ